jgi:hypothetical protein
MTGPGATPPPLICQVCGTSNPATRQFCRKCASDLRAPVPTATAPVAAASEPGSVRPVILGGGIALLAVLVLAATVIFLNAGGPGPTPTPGTAASAAPTSPTSETPSPPVTAEPTEAPTEAPPEPTPAASIRPPRIRAFTAPDSVPCGAPSYDGYIIVTWDIRNATGVTISIDGPGVYQEYEGRTGREELPFPCSGPHTYLLTTVGGVGPPATKEVTVVPVYPDEPSPTGF